MPREDGRVLVCPVCGELLSVWQITETLETWHYDLGDRIIRSSESKTWKRGEPYCGWCDTEFPRSPGKPARGARRSSIAKPAGER